jgi:hypothetical protein
MNEQITIAGWLVSQAEASFDRVCSSLRADSEEGGRYDYEEEGYYADQLVDERRYVLAEWA